MYIFVISNIYWSKRSQDVPHPFSARQEAADFALNHRPAPISKREVHKTNRREKPRRGGYWGIENDLQMIYVGAP